MYPVPSSEFLLPYPKNKSTNRCSFQEIQFAAQFNVKPTHLIVSHLLTCSRYAHTRFDSWYWVIELTFESWYHCTTVNYRDCSVRGYHDRTVLPCGVSPCPCSWDKTVCGQPVSSVARALQSAAQEAAIVERRVTSVDTGWTSGALWRFVS